MNISNVTKEDAFAIAHLMNALKIAKYPDLSGKDIDVLHAARGWLQQLAVTAAAQLKTPAVSDNTFKVKAMGPLPGKLKTNKKKK